MLLGLTFGLPFVDSEVGIDDPGGSLPTQVILWLSMFRLFNFLLEVCLKSLSVYHQSVTHFRVLSAVIFCLPICDSVA